MPFDATNPIYQRALMEYVAAETAPVTRERLESANFDNVAELLQKAYQQAIAEGRVFPKTVRTHPILANNIEGRIFTAL